MVPTYFVQNVNQYFQLKKSPIIKNLAKENKDHYLLEKIQRLDQVDQKKLSWMFRKCKDINQRYKKKSPGSLKF